MTLRAGSEGSASEDADDSEPDFSRDVSAVVPGGGFYGVFTSMSPSATEQQTVQPSHSRWVQYHPVEARAPDPQSHQMEPSLMMAPLHSVAAAPLSGSGLDAAYSDPEQMSSPHRSAWAAPNLSPWQEPTRGVLRPQRGATQGNPPRAPMMSRALVRREGEPRTESVATSSKSLSERKPPSISSSAQTPGPQPQLTERQKRYRQERDAAEVMAAWNAASTTFALNSDGNWEFVGQGQLSVNAKKSRARDARNSPINESMSTLVRPEPSTGSYTSVPEPSDDGHGNSVHPTLTQNGPAGGSDVDHWGLRDPSIADADMVGILVEAVPEWSEWIVDADVGDEEMQFP